MADVRWPDIVVMRGRGGSTLLRQNTSAMRLPGTLSSGARGRGRLHPPGCTQGEQWRQLGRTQGPPARSAKLRCYERDHRLWRPPTRTNGSRPRMQGVDRLLADGCLDPPALSTSHTSSFSTRGADPPRRCPSRLGTRLAPAALAGLWGPSRQCQSACDFR
jgi:hypothetical protein